MTSRISHLTVVLVSNMRDDDAAGMIEAIRHIKGVLQVVPGLPADNISEAIAKSRLRNELLSKVCDVILGITE